MSLDDTLTTLRAKAFGRGNLARMAKEANISDDTLRRILGDSPPDWVKTYRRLEALASAPAAGAVETGGEEVHGA